MARGRGPIAGVLAVAAFLVGGVVLSVAIAWGAELLRAFRASNSTASELATWYQMQDPLSADGVLSVGVIRGLGREEWTTDRQIWNSPSRGSGLPTLPSWFEPPVSIPGAGSTSRAFGLPFRCLRWQMTRSLTETAPNAHTINVHRRGVWDLTLSGGRFTATLPLLPMWPGLLADGAVFALLLASPWIARAIIRHRRISRGRCRFCGYDLSGALDRACPECGRVSIPTPAS
jgi:hypothetical protein